MLFLYKASEKQALDISIGSLCDYLEKYISLRFFGKANCQWTRSSNPSEMGSQIPGIDADDSGRFKHVMCCVYSAGREGEQIIDVSIMQNDGYLQPIIYATSSSLQDQNYAISQAITELLEGLYLRQEIPLIVAFADALPGDYAGMKGKSICFEITESASSVVTAIDVVMNNKVIKSYQIDDEQDRNYLYVWRGLADVLGMRKSSVFKYDETDSPSCGG